MIRSAAIADGPTCRECRSERSFRRISDSVKFGSQVVVRSLGVEGADECCGERAVLYDRRDCVRGQLAFEVFAGVLEVAFAAAVELREQPV